LKNPGTLIWNKLIVQELDTESISKILNLPHPGISTANPRAISDFILRNACNDDGIEKMDLPDHVRWTHVHMYDIKPCLERCLSLTPHRNVVFHLCGRVNPEGKSRNKTV